jgi:protein gp37
LALAEQNRGEEQMARSRIEWTTDTWNPVTGCTKVSPGCDHCYAQTFAERWRGVPGHVYEKGFDLQLRPERLAQPLEWLKPRMIFVNSMSDLFHVGVPDDFIIAVFNVMKAANWHRFQILTKRAERLARLSARLVFPENVWIGVSVESPEYYWRIGFLRNVPAHIRFLSCEPLLARLGDLPLQGINWVIVGGESGPGARPMCPSWVQQIRDQCNSNGVPFFFKQWGGIRKHLYGRTLDGRTWDQMPSGPRS